VLDFGGVWEAGSWARLSIPGKIEGAQMATKTVELSDAEGRLAELVAQVAAGTEVVLTEGNAPRARLVAVASGSVRVPGLHPGGMEASDDFDAPLPDEFWTGSV
jgi:prevent-host-death family protein